MQYLRHCLAPLLLSVAVSGFAAAPVLPSPPTVDAQAYLLMDYYSGEFLAAMGIDDPVEPASVTKLMTAYVVASQLAASHISLDDRVTISEQAWRMGGSRMFVEVGRQVSVEDLLMGVIVESGNDASVALAEKIAGSEEVFASMMNQQAKRLGLNGTNFVNSTGLPDPNHYTTARDMAILAAALIRDFPDIYKMHSIREFTYNGIKQYNRNQLLWRDESVDGVKTGHTESAGYCLVASAQRGDMRLISVVVRTASEKARVNASQALLNFGFRFYETHKLYGAFEPLASERIWKGKIELLQLGLEDNLYVTIPRGQYEQLDATLHLDTPIVAPVEKGQPLGAVKVALAGEELAERALIALQSVPEGSLFQRMADRIRLLFK
ncbi:MAG: D-alanyl-D-alanine carboxypeptidase [Gammaproteobacteria bacterium]|nr:D-alanyl-D-alanine carboxypeptidase [Gammaproteobacteria bacterium]MCI0590819.1 D-alanyl-D-alanine carboxypeptidase [Gammaproteobacteria bacterium]